MVQKHHSGDTTPTCWRSDRPFNELPRLPPKAELETRSVLKQCVLARAALAELKQATALIPNPAMLINTLPLLEAQASSATLLEGVRALESRPLTTPPARWSTPRPRARR